MTQTVLQQERQMVASASAKLSPSETLSLMEGVKFFAPTLELTKEIVLRVEQERNNQLEKIRQDPTQVEEISAQEVEPSSKSITELISAGLDEIKKLSSGLLGQTDSNLQAWQNMICQEFYHHLTFLADSPAVAAGEAFSMQKVVASSMGNLLGLSREDELLTKLSNEFASWLQTEGGEFTAGWGQITLAYEHSFYLEKFDQAEAKETEQPVGFAITVHGRNESAADETESQTQAVK